MEETVSSKRGAAVNCFDGSSYIGKVIGLTSGANSNNRMINVWGNFETKTAGGTLTQIGVWVGVRPVAAGAVLKIVWVLK